MLRLKQAVLIVATLLLSWLLMQAVHEFGHILATWTTGGSVERVVLHPLSISRTDAQPNPHPAIVAWSGPIFGTILPLAVFGTFAIAQPSNGFLRFFAGFCLIANGAYIAFGSFQRIGDCGEMLRTGSPTWILWLFGAVTIPAGLMLWNQCRSYFAVPKIDSILATLIGLAVVAITEAVLSSR
jgi:hypothetical protein